MMCSLKLVQDILKCQFVLSCMLSLYLVISYALNCFCRTKFHCFYILCILKLNNLSSCFFAKFGVHPILLHTCRLFKVYYWDTQLYSFWQPYCPIYSLISLLLLNVYKCKCTKCTGLFLSVSSINGCWGSCTTIQKNVQYYLLAKVLCIRQSQGPPFGIQSIETAINVTKLGN